MDNFIGRMAAGWESPKRSIRRNRKRIVGSTKKGFVGNIEKQTLSNNDFRRVLYTAKHTQLVLMSLNPGEDIGEETHRDVDQFFRIESGNGIVVINGIQHPISNGSAIIVPLGSRHNVINTGRKDLRLYTLYAPPHHLDRVIRATKASAENPRNKEIFKGKTTE